MRGLGIPGGRVRGGLLIPKLRELMTPDREITQHCIAVAFYGIGGAGSNSVAEFYKDLIAWFNSAQCPPNRISVDGTGFSGENVGFARTHSRLLKQGFSGVKKVTVYAMLPDGHIPTVDWCAVAFLWRDYHPCFVFSARTSITTLGDSRLARLILRCISKLKPVYGIAYQRDHDKGPPFYATGVNYGLNVAPSAEEWEDGANIQAWGDVGMAKEVYKQGILRDVYTYNYLSEPHLTRRVGTETLQHWISADSSRGRLIKLNDRMMLWNVPVPQIRSIRERLWSAGIVFDRKACIDE